MKKLSLILCLAASFLIVSSCGKDGGGSSGNEGGSEKIPADWKDYIFAVDIFDRFVDPQSGVVSYLIKHDFLGTGLDNSQSAYFVSKEMTNDERFLFCHATTNEWHGSATKVKSGIVIDLATRKKYMIANLWGGGYPYMDLENDVLYWAERTQDKKNARFYKMELLKNPGKVIPLAYFPKNLRPTTGVINRVCSHLTLTQDKQKVLLDSWVGDNFYQGLLDLYTGEYTRWDSNNNKLHLTHGQLNPKWDEEALFAIDTWKDSHGVTHNFSDIGTGWTADGQCLRMQVMKSDGTRTTVETQMADDGSGKHAGASHDTWSDDGNSIYWCSGGLWIRNLSLSSKPVKQVYNLKDNINWWEKRCTHGNLTADQKYLTCDKESNYENLETPYRGNAWSVIFYNTQTRKEVYLFTKRPQITDAQHESNLHPDPHPHFVCNGKYIVCTVSDDPYTHADGATYNDLHFAITPVDQLIQKTR